MLGPLSYLDDLLRLHVKHSGNACLADVLGDGYLYRKNPIHKRIRDCSLALGYAFTSEDVGGYKGFPLLSLDVILHAKRIPYYPNIAALEGLRKSQPRKLELKRFESLFPVKNFLLHEAAHGVAYSMFFEGDCPINLAFSNRNNLPLIISGEAFALTCEYLAACVATGYEHSLFLSLNAYRHHAQRKEEFSWLIQEFDFSAAVWMIFAGFA